MSSTSNGFLFKNCYGYCSILGNNLQGSSHRLKAVGGAYDKGRDLSMNNTIQYKGYVGSVEFSEENGVFYGKVMGIRSLISYEGENAKELLDDFHGAIDDYLETCKTEGKEPEIAFKGSFNVRLSPELHKKLFIYATAHQISINKYIEDTLADSPAAQITLV
ncbi:type II toxin-antitoxin system HicB family antitoxin [Butyricicoccus intestinisimiae]